jgi:hypothetical protein
MKISLSHAIYQFEILNSFETAYRILDDALSKAKEGYLSIKHTWTDDLIKEYNEAFKSMEQNWWKYRD